MVRVITIDDSRLTFIECLKEMVNEPQRSQILYMIEDNFDRMRLTRGSTHNHQAWLGGWIDHYTELFNYARKYYALENFLRPLPFSLHDLIIALFGHDIEKPWKYEIGEDGQWRHTSLFKTKQDAQDFRLNKLAAYGVTLTPLQVNAIEYAEGEVAGKYNNRQRMSSELAGMTHMMDHLSARVRHNYPLIENDPWPGAQRSVS